MRLSTAAKLGRVSNLPTVWTNVLAGAVVCAGPIDLVALALVLLGMSSFYVAGMFLNDFHDRHVDALQRPERPIPSGEVAAAEVQRVGSMLLLTGMVAIALAAAVTQAGAAPIVLATVLAACIVLYDRKHKRNPASPFLMATCRATVVLGSAACFSNQLDGLALGAGACLFAHVVGLTYAARSENRPMLAQAWPLVLLGIPFLFGFFLLRELDLALVIYLGAAVFVMGAVARLRPRRGRPDTAHPALHLWALRQRSEPTYGAGRFVSPPLDEDLLHPRR